MAVTSTETSGISNFSKFNANKKAAASGLKAEYLIIAGAGGSGGGSGGGGGAGGYRSSVAGELSGRNSVAETPVKINRGETYNIIVGGGGSNNTNGANSSFGQITSLGGGSGRGYGGNAGFNGGSGGGGGGPGGITTGDGAGGIGTSGQGFDGGKGRHQNQGYFVGGGGGGAGGNGGDRNTGSRLVGTGGAGLASSITGTSITRARGGGRDFQSPVANRGDGDGNGSGSSGVVIIRHPAAYGAASTTGSPSITTSGPWRIYTFTGSGTITW